MPTKSNSLIGLTLEQLTAMRDEVQRTINSPSIDRSALREELKALRKICKRIDAIHDGAPVKRRKPIKGGRAALQTRIKESLLAANNTYHG